jgi:hypothetical protein
MGKRLEYRSTLQVLRPLRQNTVRTRHWWNSIQCIRAGHLDLSAGGLLGTNVSEQGRAGYFPRIQTLLPMHETAKATRDTTEIRRCVRHPIVWTSVQYLGSLLISQAKLLLWVSFQAQDHTAICPKTWIVMVATTAISIACSAR